jgi:hypothetical protein
MAIEPWRLSFRAIWRDNISLRVRVVSIIITIFCKASGQFTRALIISCYDGWILRSVRVIASGIFLENFVKSRFRLRFLSDEALLLGYLHLSLAVYVLAKMWGGLLLSKVPKGCRCHIISRCFLYSNLRWFCLSESISLNSCQKLCDSWVEYVF